MGTIDILLTLHLGIIVVHSGHQFALGEHGADGHLEHGNTIVILYESAAAHDADHGREYPTVFLVGGEEGRDDRSRGHTVVLLLETGTEEVGDAGLDVAVLPGLLEVE